MPTLFERIFCAVSERLLWQRIELHITLPYCEVTTKDLGYNSSKESHVAQNISLSLFHTLGRALNIFICGLLLLPVSWKHFYSYVYEQDKEK